MRPSYAMDKETTRVVQSRALGKSDTLALGINGVIGSGIFFLPSVGHKLLGPAAVLSTLLAGVLAWMIAGAFGSVAKGTRRGGAIFIPGTISVIGPASLLTG